MENLKHLPKCSTIIRLKFILFICLFNDFIVAKSSFNRNNEFINESSSSSYSENDIDNNCNEIINITSKFGIIRNPISNNRNLHCQWNLIGASSDEIITISIDELNIENLNKHSKFCHNHDHHRYDSKKCCKENYLRINSLEKDEYFCNDISTPNSSSNVFISESNSISIIFSKIRNRDNNYAAAEFYLSYIIKPKFNEQCNGNEFHCFNGKCIPNKWKCNNKNECGDGSDEKSCDSSTADYIKCGDDDSMGYYHISKRCDHENDCLDGTDELNCTYCDSDQFRCLLPHSQIKCINHTLLCNGIPDCHDFSDEKKCDHCPYNKIRCGSMNHCYDPKHHRCNRVLDCPNGADELNCFAQCKGKIMCASGDGCYDLHERCNGIVQCADYSDEKNCTLELCRPDKGSFLCTNGRCIPSIWTCDRSADCYDGSDEMRCLKNSVITAAIIGSLICGLLIVIAISCGCKLIALRHLEQYRAAMTINVPNPANFAAMDFPFPSSGDLDSSLFRLEHSIMFREPPPSYASAMGGYQDVNVISNSYMEQYRRYRRQRRCRRMLRRQHRTSQQQSINPINNATNSIINTDQSNDHQSIIDNNDNNNNNISSNNETTIDVNNVITDENTSTTIVIDRNYFKQKKETIKTNNNTFNDEIDSNNVDDHHRIISTSSIINNNHISSNNNNHENSHNIELETIPNNVNNFDCDSQPLINR